MEDPIFAFDNRGLVWEIFGDEIDKGDFGVPVKTIFSRSDHNMKLCDAAFLGVFEGGIGHFSILGLPLFKVLDILFHSEFGLHGLGFGLS